MAALVATSTWRGRFGDAALRFYSRDAAAGAVADLPLTSAPVVTVGDIAPGFAAAVQPATLSAAVLDPGGVLAAARDAAPEEGDVWVDVEAPTGRGGVYRWRFAVTDAGPLARRPSAVRRPGAVAVAGRCGLARLADADAPNGPGATLARYVQDLLDACGLWDYGAVIDPALWPADAADAPLALNSGGWRDPSKVRFKAPATDDPEGTGMLVAAGSSAMDAAHALCSALTASVVVDPRPEFWVLRPGGDAAGDWGTERVPSVALLARSHTGGVAVPDAPSRSLLGTTPWTERSAAPLTAAPAAPAPVVVGVSDTYEDADAEDGGLPPLRRIEVSAPAGVDLAARIAESVGPGGTAEEAVNAHLDVSPPSPDTTGIAVAAKTDAPTGGASVGLRLDAFSGAVKYYRYDTEVGWVEPADGLPVYALLAVGAEETFNASLASGDGFEPGLVSLIAHNPEGSAVYLEASAVVSLYPPDGTVSPVTRASVTFSVGFAGRTAEVAGLPDCEYHDGAVWAPVPRWRSDAAGRAYPSAISAQAAERAAQEAAAPVPVRPDVRGLVAPPEAVDLDGVGVSHLVGAEVELGPGTSAAQTASVHATPPA